MKEISIGVVFFVLGICASLFWNRPEPAHVPTQEYNQEQKEQATRDRMYRENAVTEFCKKKGYDSGWWFDSKIQISGKLNVMCTYNVDDPVIPPNDMSY